MGSGVLYVSWALLMSNWLVLGRNELPLLEKPGITSASLVTANLFGDLFPTRTCRRTWKDQDRNFKYHKMYEYD
jgi:hypothetical protein